jgi:hypothetical protein
MAKDERARTREEKSRGARHGCRSEPAGPPLESAMGGAADFGAHGGDPASSRAIREEGRPPLPDDVPGDAAIERRHHTGRPYTGPERRIGAHS